MVENGKKLPQTHQRPTTRTIGTRERSNSTVDPSHTKEPLRVDVSNTKMGGVDDAGDDLEMQ